MTSGPKGQVQDHLLENKKTEQKEKAKCFIHDENYFRLEQSCLMFNQTLILL